MATIKTGPYRGQNGNKSYRTNAESVSKSQQEYDFAKLIIEGENKFKPGKTYRGVSDYLEKCPNNNDGRDQARLKVTLQDNSGFKKSFYKYFDIDVSSNSKFTKFLISMDAVDRNNRIMLEKLKNITVEATLFETKSGSLYIADIYPQYEEEDDNDNDEVEDETFDDDIYTDED